MLIWDSKHIPHVFRLAIASVRPDNQANDTRVPAVEQAFSSVSTLALAGDSRFFAAQRLWWPEESLAQYGMKRALHIWFLIVIACHCQAFPGCGLMKRDLRVFWRTWKSNALIFSCAGHQNVWFVVLRASLAIDGLMNFECFDILIFATTSPCVITSNSTARKTERSYQSKNLCGVTKHSAAWCSFCWHWFVFISTPLTPSDFAGQEHQSSRMGLMAATVFSASPPLSWHRFPSAAH